MAPLILHNVPDDELYVGDDGITRPYAMVFPQQDGSLPGRSRKAVTEKGAFGKSTRRSRSKTGTPARREDPTIAAADKIFSNWIASQSQEAAEASAATTSTGQRKPSGGQTVDDGTAAPAQGARFAAKPKEPTEVILRGYRSWQQQYAAINHYEQLAGRICEDYARDPPPENRRYKSELRDPAFTRRQALTPEERVKVNNANAGEHWVKVTFESAEAAEAAIYSSPQSILGYLVYAEPYRGIPPSSDEPVVDPSILDAYAAPSVSVANFARAMANPDDFDFNPPPQRHGRTPSTSAAGFARATRNPDNFDFNPPEDNADPFRSTARRRHGQAPSTSVAGFARALANPSSFDLSPPRSQDSSRTADTATLSSQTVVGAWTSGNDATVAASAAAAAPPPPSQPAEGEDEFCRVIPTVRKAKLLPVEQALMPSMSFTQRVLNHIPFVRWFSSAWIGDEVPRTDTGEFDWDKASLYWKFVCLLDLYMNLFGGEILNADRED
ncbi:hypothetical protein QBC46DRAFT_381325 [Diplogelasinospora grovesii]|uniref:Nucleoporin NUP53 n=1 Tax=Diplogelasinospora grovesii TaxID=303347 RepID=A0AAN6S6L3_9PEZI|nr:hypothetical protein QBC46DRAFT_381325 [Diplogelasinospora grovesii]